MNDDSRQHEETQPQVPESSSEHEAKPEHEPRPEGRPKRRSKPKANDDAEAAGKPEAQSTPDAAGKPGPARKPKGERKPKAARKPKAVGKPEAETEGGAQGQPKAQDKPAPVEERLPPRLKVRYREEIVPELMRELGLDNPMAVPQVRKVVINMGVGVATEAPKALEGAVNELAALSGQRPAITRARKSIAAFKVRQNNPVGCRVTLRGDRMYEFLDRLVNVALPRIRDFRGLSPRSFDGRGNYTMGIREHVIFPELSMDEIERVRGMDITITTNAKTDEAGRALLTRIGLPLRES